MVKLSRILFLTFILRLQDCVECFQNVVVVNNKQMTYNRKGELVELDKMITNLKTEKNVEKSNIFKSTAFVTDSQFKGQIKDFKSGLKKNSISNRVPPSRGHILTKKQPTKSSTIHRSSTSFPIISTSTSPSQLTAVIFSDDLSSTENSLHNTYDDIKMDFHQYLTDVTEKPQSIESTIFVFSTPSPISPIIIKNTKKKKKKKLTTTPIPVHEHIIQNLDYYRKLLGLNCTAKEAEKQENGLAASEQVVTITPKPTVKLKVPVQSASLTEKFDYEDTNESSVEGKGDKKKKKHCKKKHGHHTHEHHHKVGG